MKVEHEDGRFYVRTQHGVAELLYKKIGSGVISAYHTSTPEEDRGQGIAEQMSIALFEFVKKNGLKVRPDCPYIPYFLEKHKEWQAYSQP